MKWNVVPYIALCYGGCLVIFLFGYCTTFIPVSLPAFVVRVTSPEVIRSFSTVRLRASPRPWLRAAPVSRNRIPPHQYLYHCSPMTHFLTSRWFEARYPTIFSSWSNAVIRGLVARTDLLLNHCTVSCKCPVKLSWSSLNTNNSCTIAGATDVDA